MIEFIKKNRGFLLTMLCLVAIIVALAFSLARQFRQNAEIDRMMQLVESLTQEAAAWENSKKEADDAKDIVDDLYQSAKDARKASEKIRRNLNREELNPLRTSLATEQNALTTGAEALEAVVAMLAQEEGTVDQEQLLTQLETALVTLGGTMPEMDAEEEGTEE